MSTWPASLRTALLGILLPLAVSAGQAQTSLSPHALKLRDRVQAIGVGSKVSVIFTHEHERYGMLTSITDSTFSFHDVDDSTDHTLAYDDVTKVRSGYGGYNHLRHRHTDRTHALIIGGIVIGGLLTLAILAGRS